MYMKSYCTNPGVSIGISIGVGLVALAKCQSFLCDGQGAIGGAILNADRSCLGKILLTHLSFWVQEDLMNISLMILLSLLCFE